MSGSIKKRIQDAAEKAVRAKLDPLFHLYAQYPNTPRTFGCLDSGGSRITFQDGTSAPVIVNGLPVSRCGPVTDLGNGTYYMEGKRVEQITVDGNVLAPWFVLGAYSIDPDVIYNTGPITFPEFSLIEGKSLKQYWIDPSFLSTLYAVDPDLSYLLHPSSSEAQEIPLSSHSGMWQVQVSPDLKYIVMLRLATHAHEYPFEGVTYRVWSGRQEMKAYWAIISNFTLNDLTESVDMTFATIDQGVHVFTEIDPVRDLPVVPTPPIFGFMHEWQFIRENRGVGQITFPAGLPPRIDLVGSWYNSSMNEPPFALSNVYMSSAPWYVLDLTGVATEVHVPDFGPSIGQDPYSAHPTTFPYFTEPLATGPIFTVDPCFLDSRTNRTRSGITYDYLSWRKDNVTASLGSDITPPGLVTTATRFLFPNYATTSAIYGVADPTELFVIDSTKIYPRFNATTGWTFTPTCRVKTVSDGRFLELLPIADDQYTFQLWTYNPDPISMGKGRFQKSGSLPFGPSGFSIYTTGGPKTNWRILDWVLK